MNITKKCPECKNKFFIDSMEKNTYINEEHRYCFNCGYYLRIIAGKLGKEGINEVKQGYKIK